MSVILIAKVGPDLNFIEAYQLAKQTNSDLRSATATQGKWVRCCPNHVVSLTVNEGTELETQRLIVDSDLAATDWEVKKRYRMWLHPDGRLVDAMHCREIAIETEEFNFRPVTLVEDVAE